SVAAAEIDHAYYVISGMLRTRDLVDILTTEDPARAIIFCNTREETKLVANVLTREGYSAEAISSDLTQSAREKVMKAMRDHKIRFLVATDVAARGIDISHVTHVINYSFPEQAESYVHRTGRTGRAGRTGTAISLIGPRDIGNFYYLKLQYTSIKPEERHLPPPEELQAARIQLKIDEISRRFPEQVSPQWVVLARGLMGDPRGEQVIAFLLEQAMRSTRQPRSLLDEDDEGNEQAHAHRGAGSEQLSSTTARRASREEREYEGERGRERGPRSRDGRRGPNGRRGRDSRDRDSRRGRDGRGRDGRRDRSDQTGERRSEETQESLADAETHTPAEAGASATTTQVHATATEAPATEITTAEAAPTDKAATNGAAATEEPRPARKTRRERRPRRRRREGGDADSTERPPAQDAAPIGSPDESNSGDDAGPSVDAAGSSETKTDEEGQPRRRRRRRRRGRRKPGSEDTATANAAKASNTDEDTATTEAQEPVAATADTKASTEESATAEESPTRRRRRRRRRSSAGSANSTSSTSSTNNESTRQAKPQPIPRVSQDEIIIDIDESELDAVRDHFGEVDELDDLTLKSRRRAVIDTLHDEVEIVDLSSEDASAEEEEPDKPETQAADTHADPESSAATASQESSDESEAPKKRRRRRRRRKTQSAEMPELTAPPHKDFWEVWSTRFTFTDFEDDKYLDKSELEEQAREAEAEAKAEAAAKEARSAPRRRARRSDQGEIPEASFVKIRLNLGRRHGQKAATIRALLRDQLGLEGRVIRDLTVRDASTLFRSPEDDYERISSVLNGVEIGGVTIAVARPDSPKTDLRAPPPELPAANDKPANSPGPSSGAEAAPSTEPAQAVSPEPAQTPDTAAAPTAELAKSNPASADEQDSTAEVDTQQIDPEGAATSVDDSVTP
ncbi:MAG TPA: hypothetical protein ENJ18_05620, partial [Nannocystis exedens]|nr:hypothetical protein [Nannocystis exedens]